MNKAIQPTYSIEASQLLDWIIDLLTKIECSAKPKAWCKKYSVYDLASEQDELLQNLNLFRKYTYEAGMVIANYRQVIEYWKLDEEQIMRADLSWLAERPYLSVLASIAWHFRRDHFCEGTLIDRSIADGSMLRLFRRLKEVCPSSAPAVTVKELCCNNCSSIPDVPGVYWILAPEGMPILFHEREYHPKAQIYPFEKLHDKFERCTEHKTLYIGKAEGTHGLRQRLKQYMDYGQGKGNVHRGGRAIWQIENSDLLLVAYEVCKHPAAQEHQLLQEYREQNGTYPLANWRG